MLQTALGEPALSLCVRERRVGWNIFITAHHGGRANRHPSPALSHTLMRTQRGLFVSSHPRKRITNKANQVPRMHTTARTERQPHHHRHSSSFPRQPIPLGPRPSVPAAFVAVVAAAVFVCLVPPRHVTRPGLFAQLGGSC